MHGLDQHGMLEKMKELGVDYHTHYPKHHRLGTYYAREKVSVNISEDHLGEIPERHRTMLGTDVVRTIISELDIGYFGDVENRVDVVFGRSLPVLRTEYL